MNSEQRKRFLSDSLKEATQKAAEADATKAQIERIAKDVRAKLAHKIHASDDEVVCPNCGYAFDPDSDGDESDGFRTDPVTSGTGQEDEDNVGDRPTQWDNRKLTPLQRALKSKGIDPFSED